MYSHAPSTKEMSFSYMYTTFLTSQACTCPSDMYLVINIRFEAPSYDKSVQSNCNHLEYYDHGFSSSKHDERGI